MSDTKHLWGQKNETLSDKSAAKEYGISREEIIEAINSGELQYKLSSMHGNPWFRLLRVEVERLVEKKHGSGYLKEIKVKKELTIINRELKELKKKIAELEERRDELLNM